MFLAPVDTNGCILFNFVVIITNDSHLWSVYAIVNFWLCTINDLFGVIIVCKFGKFHCVCNLL